MKEGKTSIEFTDDDLDATILRMIQSPTQTGPTFANKLQQIAGMGAGRKTPGIPGVPSHRTSAIERLPRMPQV